MRSAIKQQAIKIADELRTNKRLQAISLIALLLLIMWIHVQLNAWHNRVKAVAIAGFAKYEDTLAVANQRDWPQRAEQVNQQLRQYKSQLWTAASEGEAEARFRDWLQQQAGEAGIPVERITVEVGVTPRGSLWVPVHADFQGKYIVGNWQKMLEMIENGDKAVSVDFEQLNLANSQSPFYRLNLTSWFLIGSTQEAE